MELIRDTPFEAGFLFWPVRPPRATMLVVVKATFLLEPGVAPLAPASAVPTGELFWEDDPACSVRYPTDFALLKPRGECFVIGHVRTLTGRPETRTTASFRVGAVEKKIAVHGDRAWTGGSPTSPVPFTEMPLRWERALGGPGFAPNPMGRGLAPDAEGVTWLPNLEPEERLVLSPRDRPDPAASFALGHAWPARRALTGTYDERWRASRFPWLPDDFRFAYFNEAPTDQQIEGFWTGDEELELVHLHPRHPRLRTRLLGVRARAFVERAADARTSPGAFEELALSLDTLVVDADLGVAHAIWRGQLELEHDRLEPAGIDRLFVMHEPLPGAGARPPAATECRERMRDKLARDRAALDAMRGAAPPPMDADAGATVADAPSDALAEARRALEIEQATQAAAAAPDPLSGLAKLRAELKLAGVDVDALIAKAEADAPPEAPVGPATMDELGKAFGDLGLELPEELKADFAAAMAEKQAMEAAGDPTPKAPPEPDLRALVIARHAKGTPLEGDLSGVSLSGLDLHGLDARGVILRGADFRGTNLSGAKLDDATLVGADLLSANLSGASLRRADLTDAVLEAVNLTGARLERATLERAELQEATLDRANLSHADLTGCDLRGASLRETVLDEAVLNAAKLGGAKLVQTSLVDTRLYGVEAQGLVFEGANLDKARFGRGADVSGSTFRGSSAVGSKWRDTDLRGARFERTNLEHADFTSARLDGASLAGCSIRFAIFIKSAMPNATLRDADLYEACMMQANLHGVDLRGANLFRVNLFEAYGEGVSVEGANLDGTYWERR